MWVSKRKETFLLSSMAYHLFYLICCTKIAKESTPTCVDIHKSIEVDRNNGARIIHQKWEFILTVLWAFWRPITAVDTCLRNLSSILINTETVRTIALAPVISTIRSAPRNVLSRNWIFGELDVTSLTISVIRLSSCKKIYAMLNFKRVYSDFFCHGCMLLFFVLSTHTLWYTSKMKFEIVK